MHSSIPNLHKHMLDLTVIFFFPIIFSQVLRFIFARISLTSFSFFVQRTVIVPPEAGYGQKGMNEIPVSP